MIAVMVRAAMVTGGSMMTDVAAMMTGVATMMTSGAAMMTSGAAMILMIVTGDRTAHVR